MRTMNALQLRQSLGKALIELQKTGEPILIEKSRHPAAFLISIQDFEEHFAEKLETDRVEKLMARMRAIARPAVDKTPSEVIIRELRDSRY